MILTLDITRLLKKVIPAQPEKPAPVYVGTMEFPFRRMIMFHMASPDVNQLHLMANKIGVSRRHFQDPSGPLKHPHYDICKSKKYLALSHGAIELRDIELVRRCFPDLRKIIDEN